MVSYQLFHHGIQFGIRAGKYFSLFRLEHHTLDILHLGRRSAQTEIFRITLNIVHAPFGQFQIRAFVHQRKIILVGILCLLSTLRVLVFHHETCVSRTTRSGRTVHGHHARHRASSHFNTSFQTTFDRHDFPVTTLNFFSIGNLR